MKRIKLGAINFLLGIFISTTFLIPVISYAQEDPIEVGGEAQLEIVSLYKQIKEEEGKYKFIVPLGPFSSVVSDTTDLTTGDALVKYLRTWFKFLIGIGGIIGVVRLVMVGFEIITTAGNVNAKSKIKDEITAIVTSLVLVAGSWVFLNTLNPALVNSSIFINKTVSTSSATEIVEQEGTATTGDQITAGINGKGFYFMLVDKKTGIKRKEGPFGDVMHCVYGIQHYQPPKSNPELQVDGEECYDHTDFNISIPEKKLRDMMAKERIYVNKHPCGYPTQKDCTNLNGLSIRTLNEVVTFSRNCCGGQPDCTVKTIDNQVSCPVVISGGTEAGHQTHGLWAPDTFDLRYNAIILTFLKSKATYVAPSFSGTTRYRYNGYWYTDELRSGFAHHFHVCKAVTEGAAECKDYDDARTESNCVLNRDSQAAGGQYKCK